MNLCNFTLFILLAALVHAAVMNPTNDLADQVLDPGTNYCNRNCVNNDRCRGRCEPRLNHPPWLSSRILAGHLGIEASALRERQDQRVKGFRDDHVHGILALSLAKRRRRVTTGFHTRDMRWGFSLCIWEYGIRDGLLPDARYMVWTSWAARS
ncbi:hypothetical protein BO82DRAFT_370112 [Aspergillus uvarum CBS 121591]|uniref:Uncharacterized protein n=1 Tax=Aspergillus uvarum CBS 121591 TaxID=1448315 RepID=A0A319BVK4_9EURO|nr:hypothetical protein BO82DRAFT_370112 [Aspergillus uvarum CBS 121591]PYH75569.1 hypothetical protein BO82DRAFT_370112 [Aspergillus uvarum CBS 121591]